MHLGYALPLGDIGGDPATIREIAAIAEAAGFNDLTLADHVLGVNVASRPGWTGRSSSTSLYHDPFVLFGFLAAACSPKMSFSTQVLILPQRQTVLVAKQAASLAVLCEGRFRLGVGVGWNEAEFIGLNENFHNRGRRSEEQVQVMQALWAQGHVAFKGRWHEIPDAGINPRPPGGKVPLWFGGHMEATLRRIAKWGDGWIQLAYPAGQQAIAQFDELRRMTEAEGRDPRVIGLEAWVSCAEGGEREWREEFLFWKRAGLTHLTLHNTYNGFHHKRIAARDMATHVALLRRWKAAVEDLA
jgi:probable F420-dependent oxidoreductase